SAVPLSAADLVAPDLGLTGTLDGEATIAGPLSAPTGAYYLRLANLRTTQTKASGLPPIDAEASGSLEGTRTRLDAKFTAREAGRATVTGAVPLSSDGSLENHSALFYNTLLCLRIEFRCAVQSSALIDGVLQLHSCSFRTAAAQLSIGFTGHHHRQSGAV